MSFTDWLKNREQKVSQGGDKKAVPDGVWSKCTACNHIIFQKDIISSYRVCPECDHHFALSPVERVSLLLDDGSFSPLDAHLKPQDPLDFSGHKPYRQSLNKAMETTGLDEAVITGWGSVNGHPVGLGVMEFGFIGGSMGSVVGEKITRLFEAAAAENSAVITVSGSGGARMQEGLLSLLQMAKTTAAVEQHRRTGQPYISILTNPTTGGVLASFASLGDVVIAEPGALIGFAGPRVIEQALKETLPKGFQTAESVLGHGIIDMIVPRSEMREKIRRLIDYLTDRPRIN